jgi:acyl carrier protein
MTRTTAEAVHELILERLDEQLAAKGLTPSDVPPSFDGLLEGGIDCFGVVAILMLLEERVGRVFDFDELPADDLTRIGPLSQYVERKSSEQ